MKSRILGRTGLEVSELSLGAAFVTDGTEGFAGAASVIHRAIEYGMNLVDTLADYGDSEKAVGEGLKDVTAPVIVSTKLGPRNSDFNPKSMEDLRRTVKESLEILHRDVIDILMIHEPDRSGQLDWWTDYDTFKGPVRDLLLELKESGVIKYTGLGGTTAYEIVRIMATGEYDVLLTAFNYSMLWREAAIEVLPEAKRQNMGILLASPTQQGWLAERFDDQVYHGAPWLSKPRREQFKKLYALVDKVGIPIAEMSLRWAMGNPYESVVLTGPRNVAQLEQNVKAAKEGPLPNDLVDRIDEIAAMVPFRPFEEPFGCPFRDPAYHRNVKRPGMA